MVSAEKSQSELAWAAGLSLVYPERWWGRSSCTRASASIFHSFCWGRASSASSLHHKKIWKPRMSILKREGWCVPAPMGVFTKVRVVISAGADIFTLVLSKKPAWAAAAAHCGTGSSGQIGQICLEMMSTCWGGCYALRTTLQSILLVVPGRTTREVLLPSLQWHLWWQRRCFLLLDTSVCWDCFVLLWGREAKVNKHLPVSWNGW